MECEFSNSVALPAKHSTLEEQKVLDGCVDTSGDRRWARKNLKKPFIQLAEAIQYKYAHMELVLSPEPTNDDSKVKSPRPILFIREIAESPLLMRRYLSAHISSSVPVLHIFLHECIRRHVCLSGNCHGDRKVSIFATRTTEFNFHSSGEQSLH